MNTIQFCIVALASLATAGFGIGLLRILGLRDLPSSLTLGAGYALGVVAISHLLHLANYSGASLSTAGWIMTGFGLIVGAWTMGLRRTSSTSVYEPLNNGQQRVFAAPATTWYRDPVVVGALLLLAVHLLLTFSNNAVRPIFPWDAFTTWMYRAKAWALQNAITPTASINDWLAAGGQSGYALYASHYPTALSIYAAFMSALVGGWQPAAASIPWSLCLLALCMTAHGLLTLAGVGNRLAVVGAYLLGSMPLLNIHAALAGYGDLWVALYSGSGLAALLAWRVSGKKTALWLALLMLIAGTQIKTEGWLWLGLGLSFLTLEWLAHRSGYLKLMACNLVIFGLIWGMGITLFNLGPLGQWGMDDTHIHVGALGSYALRHYNPAGNYWGILFGQANFLLLGSFFLVTLTVATVRGWPHATSLWLMGSFVAGSQWIIFGLSSYSLYAETSTAIARLFLQFVPVATVSIILSWAAFSGGQGTEGGQVKQLDHQEVPDYSWPKLISSAALIGVIIIAPLGLLAMQTPPSLQATSDQMTTVLGETKATQAGKQFIQSPINVGVLKAPNTIPVAPHRYLRSDATIPNAESASFYWINEGEAQVNSTPLTLSGESLIDLNQHAAWRSGKKRELGFLIQTSEFGDTYFRGFSLSDDLDITSFQAIFNQWNADEALTQKSINNTLGHHDSPISLTAWITNGMALLVSLFAVLLITKRAALLKFVGGPVLLGLWVIADTMALTTTPVTDCLNAGSQCLTSGGDDPHGRELINLADKILAHTPPESPLLIIHEGDVLGAQKLPLILLPRSAIYAEQPQVPTDWAGSIVVLSKNKEALDDAVLSISSRLGRSASMQLTKTCVIFGPSL